MGLLGNVMRGAAAGLAGTLAMDLFRYRDQGRGKPGESFVDWELSKETDNFEDAPAPAKMGKMAADALGVDLPESSAGMVNDVMHWLTGAGYGVIFQGLLIQDRRNPAASGLATGVGTLLNAYVVLGALGIYKPMWEYDAGTLLKDLQGHLVYGGVTALTYRLLD